MIIDRNAARQYFHGREEQRRERREAERQKWLVLASQAIRHTAPQHPDIARVYLYGSITQPGRFYHRSDIDVAVVADNIAAETPYWRALERALRRDVDLRPLEPPLTRAVEYSGILVYERQDRLSD